MSATTAFENAIVIYLDFGGVLTDSPFPAVGRYSTAFLEACLAESGYRATEQDKAKFPSIFRDINLFANFVSEPHSAFELLELGKISRTEFCRLFKQEASTFFDFIEGKMVPHPKTASSDHRFDAAMTAIRTAYDPVVFNAEACCFLRESIDPEAFLSILERCPIRRDVIELLKFVKKAVPAATQGRTTVRIGVITNNWEGELFASQRLVHSVSDEHMYAAFFRLMLGSHYEQVFDDEMAIQSVLCELRKPSVDIYKLAGEAAARSLGRPLNLQGGDQVLFIDDLPKNIQGAIRSDVFSHTQRARNASDVTSAISALLTSEVSGRIGIPARLGVEAKEVVDTYARQLVSVPTSPNGAIVTGQDIPSAQRFSPEEMKRLMTCLRRRLPGHFVPEGVDSPTDRLFDEVQGFGNPIVEYFKGGMSNPTYRLTTRTGSYVLRKQPKGKLLKGAHNMKREYQLFTQLRQTSPVPVPHTLTFVGDRSVLGTDFFVMRYVNGHIIRDSKELFEVPSGRTPEVHKQLIQRYFTAAMKGLVQLHAAPAPTAVTRGRPLTLPNTPQETPLFRLVTIWKNQYEAGRRRLGEASSASKGGEAAAPKLDFRSELFEKLTSALEEVIEFLPLPSRMVLCHGDYKLDNMVFSRNPAQVAGTAEKDISAPELLALLDFELAAIGDPMTDVAYFSLFHLVLPPRGILGIPKAQRSLFPSTRQILEEYCNLSGYLAEVPANQRYQGFLIYQAAMCHKLCGIMHGVVVRAMMGNASDVRGGMKLKKFFEVLVKIGLGLLQKSIKMNEADGDKKTASKL